MINKFWNHKLSGLPCGIGKICSAIWKRLSVALSSAYYRGNLGMSGRNVKIGPNVYFRNPLSIKMGDGVYVGEKTVLINDEIPMGQLVLKNGVSIDRDCHIDFSGGLIIENESHIAWGTYIITHDHGYDYRNKPMPKPLRIGREVFVGAKSIITPGCSEIGDYAVIGTGSVVTKDVPSRAIFAGNPARLIKYRDDL